jgi:hypothetical protein
MGVFKRGLRPLFTLKRVEGGNRYNRGGGAYTLNKEFIEACPLDNLKII